MGPSQLKLPRRPPIMSLTACFCTSVMSLSAMGLKRLPWAWAGANMIASMQPAAMKSIFMRFPLVEQYCLSAICPPYIN